VIPKFVLTTATDLVTFFTNFEQSSMERKMLSAKWFNRSMINLCVVIFVGTLAFAAVDSTKTPAAKPDPLMTSHAPTAPALPSEYYVLEVRHRVFTNFLEVDTVGMNQKFSIGEAEDSGEVILFNPHLGITDSGKIVQVSDTLYNPAVRIRVTNKDSLIQESWGFHFGSAPHYRRNDLLGFRLIDFRVNEKFIRVDAPKAIPAKPADTTAKKK
jgi:hypothetical protein